MLGKKYSVRGIISYYLFTGKMISRNIISNSYTQGLLIKKRTADYQTTRGLKEIIERDGNTDDIKALLMDRNLPVDEISLEKIAQEILENPPLIGYLTISNALQWRLQYSRVIKLEEHVEGVVRIYDR